MIDRVMIDRVMDEQRMNCRAFLMKSRLGVQLRVEALPKNRLQGRRDAASTRTSKRASRRFPTIWDGAAFENVKLRITQTRRVGRRLGWWPLVACDNPACLTSASPTLLLLAWIRQGRKEGTLGAAVGPKL
jgi:hypothetical protein